MAEPDAGSPWVGVASGSERFGFAVASGLDGRLYAIGGDDEMQGLLRTTEVYDPTRDHWSVRASLAVARAGLLAVTANDGRIYALGGEGAARPQTTVEAYVARTNSWSTIAPMPRARTYFAAASARDGRVYVMGGSDPLDASMDAYDPRRGRWAVAPRMPTARSSFAAVEGADGRIYAMGGRGGDTESTVLAVVEVYEPATASWTRAADLPTARETLVATAGADGRIYAIGGRGAHDDAASKGAPLAVVQVYEPKRDVWTSLPGVPLPHDNFAFGPTTVVAAASGVDGRIYAFLYEWGDGSPGVVTVETCLPPPLAVDAASSSPTRR